MLKGLIGIVLPGGAILAWAALTWRWRLVPKLFAPGPLLVFLALAVPWHVLVATRNPSFLSFYFVHEHFQRFATKAHRRTGSPLYFVGVLLAGFLPWTAFLGRVTECFEGRGLARFRGNATASFLLVFSATVFLFFSASSSKLIPYVQPIWAPLAVLLGAGLSRALERGAPMRGERIAAAALLGLLLAFGVGFAVGGGFVRSFGIGPGAGVILAALFIGFLAMLWPRALPLVPAVAVPWLLLVAGALGAFPSVARAITPWPVAEAARRELSPGQLFWQRGHFLEVLPFYLDRLTPISDLAWSELDFGRAQPHAPELFPDDEAFRAAWNGQARMLVAADADHLKIWSDPRFALTPPILLAKEGNLKRFLFANR
jgi:4-amino-4-deoxy-L-arabinose transferase-like glycosyltransferase